MDNKEKEVFETFRSDLDAIASELIKCFGLRHTGDAGRLENPLMRWLDFRLRYIVLFLLVRCSFLCRHISNIINLTAISKRIRLKVVSDAVNVCS